MAVWATGSARRFATESFLFHFRNSKIFTLKVSVLVIQPRRPLTFLFQKHLSLLSLALFSPPVVLLLVRRHSTAGHRSSLSVLPPSPLILLVLLLLSKALVLSSPSLSFLLLGTLLLSLKLLPDLIYALLDLIIVDVEAKDVSTRSEVLTLLQTLRGLDHLGLVPGPGAYDGEGDDQEGREDPDSNHSVISEESSDWCPHTDW